METKIQKVQSIDLRPKTDAHLMSVNGCLAESLVVKKEVIMGEWIERIRKDDTIPTETLTTIALRDHLPQLFDDLIKTLRRYGSSAVAEQSEKDAEEHGATRWQQGFELTQMLGEIKHLRAVLIYHLRHFEEQNQDFGMVERLFVTSILHRFLDEMGIDATRQFLDEGYRTRAPSNTVSVN